MKTTHFKARVWKVGNSLVVTIPKMYIPDIDAVVGDIVHVNLQKEEITPEPEKQ